MISMREKQKAEAIVRLELMGVREDVRRKFEENGTVMLCKDGQYYPCDGRIAAEIHEFELEQHAVVFLAVSIFGMLDTFLYVSKYEDEWEWGHEDIKNGYAMGYTINRSYPTCSEFGGIAFRTTKDGSIIREG